MSKMTNVFPQLIIIFPLTQVLIIGGGDGGVLREVVKNPLVESVVLCEIDEDVINVSKKYLPGMAKGFFSPKLTLHVGDGFEFMKQNQDAFDVIITDSSDPVGQCLLRTPFTVAQHVDDDVVCTGCLQVQQKVCLRSPTIS